MSPRAPRAPELRIGCSGWNYEAWRRRFYPSGLPPAGWLAHYATVFDTVEANGTFYRLPEPETFAAWRAQTPAGFLMAVKASRYLTHLKRLREPEAPLERLFERASGLGPRLGPVLYQLPPQMRIDLDRLDHFLRALPRRIAGRRRLRHVVEFRDQSWYTPDTFALLEAHDVALCLHDKRGAEIAEPAVGPFVYVQVPRDERPLPRRLRVGGARPLGRAPGRPVASGPRRLCLFQQRPRRRRDPQRDIPAPEAVPEGAEVTRHSG